MYIPINKNNIMNTDRKLSYGEAIREAIDLCMEKDPFVYIIGEGVPDPKGIFGTTLNLVEKYGEDRVMDMPISENGMTGIAIGTAITGMRPIITHQRMDFVLLAMDQIINNASKWHYMFGGKSNVPIVIRLIIGRGWGQGPQHSQSLQTWFTHVPGLKVVMPTTPYDAKGLLISSIEDNNPVIFIEHRWLHNISDYVPKGVYRVPIGKANIIKEGNDLTIVCMSYMTIEAIRASKILATHNINVEIIDVRTLKPLDEESILNSVQKTGHLIVLDTSWKTSGFSSEIISLVSEKSFHELKTAPIRITLPDIPAPSTPALSSHYYPIATDIINAVVRCLKLNTTIIASQQTHTPLDVPDITFTGPF